MISPNFPREAAGLFHQCWGQAKASPEYDKQKWKALERALHQLAEAVAAPSPGPALRMCSVGSGALLDETGEVVVDATQGDGNVVLIGDEDAIKAAAGLLFDLVTIAKAKGDAGG